MNQPVIIWTSVVAVLILAFAIRTVECLFFKNKKKHSETHFFEMGQDKDIFYCPGDENLIDEDEIEE